MWAGRLQDAERASAVAAAQEGSTASARKAPTLARVVRAGVPAMPASDAGPRAAVEVLVGDVRVRVERDVDETALRVILRALGVAR
jgi:hypothetical protein